MKKKYDVGIYGWWGHENFGGCLTYYALEREIKSLGFSVLMIQEGNGLPGRYTIPDNCIAMNFAKKNYDYTRQTHVNELRLFNEMCDIFMVGGDQLWNYKIVFSKEDMFLNFVDDDKTKLSYSTSFGNSSYNPPQEYLDSNVPLLKRFDSVTVREDYAVDIANKYFNTKADRIIDAVFLPDVKVYFDAALEADVVLPKNKYLVAFILNPSIEKRTRIEIIAKKLDLDILCIPDAASAYHDSFFKVFEGLKIMSPLSVENFLKSYINSSYVITDSFHGTCMAYIFRKPFSVFYNNIRGIDRFISLMSILKLHQRRINEDLLEEDIINNENISFDIDWTKAEENVSYERSKAISWLKKHLKKKTVSNIEKQNSFFVFRDLNQVYYDKDTLMAIENLHKNPDFVKIRLLATLLRDYGVKHVVLSPGGRDVPLIRMFENNDDKFVLHRVTDERSAAYFGLGIASYLNEPVACICTSGTAASNFLPAVTEAYYTGIPLIVITADRREVFLNQGEDQTIPQKNIYHNVVKKEVSLPEAGGWMAEMQSRRDISDCILETTHHNRGPVHINISIDNISIGDKLPRSAWSLLPFIYPHILRTGVYDTPKKMDEWVTALKKSNRILLVYGQNQPLSKEELFMINEFARKYNCVIVTDTISNLDCDYCLQPFLMLNSINQDTFNKELAPDILISVGGKRLMNDPLTFKVRGGPGNIRHWSVTSDGKIKDFYFRLTSVIECSQDYFFEYFVKNSGNITNNNEYFSKWKALCNKYSAPMIDKFNSLYILGSFLPNIPKNSYLHLGVGQSFFDCRRYKLDSSIKVYCNMGTNGIDGCTSSFMGQCAVAKEQLCFLIVGDLSFFYDMNSIWNKKLSKNMRILMVNNNGSGLLKSHNLKGVTSIHNTKAEGWVRETGFEYISANNKLDFEEKLKYFLSTDPDDAVFFEVLCDR